MIVILYNIVLNYVSILMTNINVSRYIAGIIIIIIYIHAAVLIC